VNAKDIRELRRSLNLTQEELARLLDVSFVTISRWERGLGWPHPKNIRKLLELKAQGVSGVHE
jgi:transcriptional regulator with XRE-family HTH domain